MHTSNGAQSVTRPLQVLNENNGHDTDDDDVTVEHSLRYTYKESSTASLVSQNFARVLTYYDLTRRVTGHLFSSSSSHDP